MQVLAVDPGREKCGLAVVEAPERIVERGIVATSSLEQVFQAWLSRWNPEKVLLGNGTYSQAVKKKLEPLVGGTPLVVVNERDSTYLARKLYFKHKPPRGIWRLVPLGLQVPPEPYDDFAAAFMAIRYLSESPGDR